MVHGLLVAVLEGGRCDCPGLMLVAVWKVRVLGETSLLAGLIVMAVVEAFVPRCILMGRWDRSLSLSHTHTQVFPVMLH